MKFFTLVLCLIVTTVFAGTAVFTGKHELTLTEDGESGVRCEFDYNGRLFWVTFIGTQFCPNTLTTD